MAAHPALDGRPIAVRGGPIPGATPIGGGRTQFVVWAPDTQRVQVQLGREPERLVDLVPVASGYHGAVVEECPVGTRYRYLLDDGPAMADPASRYQPEGVHGPSEVVDLDAYLWGDAAYVQRPLWRQVISEWHIGSLTPGGTFDSAIAVLDGLCEVGIGAVELMPLAQFAGARNWGYDGVFPFAVQNTYGGPAALQRFVDACHQRGLAVVLDVVYNHLGPEGNVLGAFGPYLTDRYRTPWGPAINFDGAGCDQVRAFFLGSAVQWFADYHIDALRLDAVHGIVDTSALPFLAELSALADDLAESLGRPCRLIAESANNDPRVVTERSSGGLGMDAQWNDDFHHAMHALLTGERVGYYADFGRLEDLARAMNDGFVYQGEYSVFRRRRHGAPSSGLAPERFVLFAQNHDHIGNRPHGERLAQLVPFDRQRLAAGLLFLAAGIPLLFMGEEYGDTAPFPFFVDYEDPNLVEAVRKGRAQELAEFGFALAPLDAGAEETFRAAVLDPRLRQAEGHRGLLALHARLIALRATHPALARSRRVDARAMANGSVLTLVRRDPVCSAVAMFNLGGDRVPASIPSLTTGADAADTGWVKLLDSADPAFEGSGVLAPEERPAGGSVLLDPWSFCVYGTVPERPITAP
jgi:maltooligosyltrehalose trehalohydrolase